MLVVWHQSSRYNGSCLVSTWIFAIAYRKALKALSRLDEAVEDDGLDSRPSSDPGPEQSLGREELRQRLAQALRSLSPDERAAVAAHLADCAACRAALAFERELQAAETLATLDEAKGADGAQVDTAWRALQARLTTNSEPAAEQPLPAGPSPRTGRP